MTLPLIFGFILGFSVGITTAFFLVSREQRLEKEEAQQREEQQGDSEGSEERTDQQNLLELNEKMRKEKAERKERIVEALEDQERMTNDDVQALLGVSDATATRYLDELEAEKLVTQHGRGKKTFYTLRKPLA